MSNNNAVQELQNNISSYFNKEMTFSDLGKFITSWTANHGCLDTGIEEVHKLYVELGLEMTHFESFAVGQFLSSWPSDYNYDDIMEVMEDGDPEHLIVICERYEVYPSEDVAAFIDELKSDLESKFIPKQRG